MCVYVRVYVCVCMCMCVCVCVLDHNCACWVSSFVHGQKDVYTSLFFAGHTAALACNMDWHPYAA